MTRAAAVAALGLTSMSLTLTASASAPPVGPLPKGPTTMIQVQHGLYFALALPHGAKGQYWRGARPSDPTIAKPISDADLDGAVVLLYKAGHAGKTTLVYALTKDEETKALKSHTFKITVK